MFQMNFFRCARLTTRLIQKSKPLVNVNLVRCMVESSKPPSTLPPTKPAKKQLLHVTWKSVAFAVVAGGGLLLYMWYLRNLKLAMREKNKNRSMGKASIGGPYNLIDHNGKPKSNEDFLGQWVLMYFGFTNCPDICPEEMEKMSKVTDLLRAEVKDTQFTPLFVSVDPERDTAESIKLYCKEFHPDLLGLTGSVEKVGQICKAYRVYFSAGPKDDEADYIVDHTIIMYLMDPNGEFTEYYPQTKTAREISYNIMTHIKLFKAAQ